MATKTTAKATKTTTKAPARPRQPLKSDFFELAPKKAKVAKTAAPKEAKAPAKKRALALVKTDVPGKKARSTTAKKSAAVVAISPGLAAISAEWLSLCDTCEALGIQDIPRDLAQYPQVLVRALRDGRGLLTTSCPVRILHVGVASLGQDPAA